MAEQRTVAMRADAQLNRERILAVAYQAFAEDPRVSMNAIAKRAGVGAGTLYRHFPTREDLVLAVYQQEVQTLVEAVDGILDEHPPLDALRVWFLRLAAFVRGADVLITDTTYRDHEYPSKVDWGHSCVSQVADLAARAEVKRLHLFHHDPDQTDDDIDKKLDETRKELQRLGSSVVCDAPAEGSELVL